MREKWFKRWEVKRRKGRLHYIITHTLIIGFAVIFGRFLGVALFSNQRLWGSFWSDLPILIATLFVLGVTLNYLAWVVGEYRYQKQRNMREKTKQE